MNPDDTALKELNAPHTGLRAFGIHGSPEA
jgi:hypothetical protein